MTEWCEFCHTIDHPRGLEPRIRKIRVNADLARSCEGGSSPLYFSLVAYPDIADYKLPEVTGLASSFVTDRAFRGWPFFREKLSDLNT